MIVRVDIGDQLISYIVNVSTCLLWMTSSLPAQGFVI
jgi:hypothetical protein